MGINGYFYGKTSNSAIKPKITWEAVSDTLGNYSDVTATLSYSRKDSYTTGGYWAGSITIDGDTKSRSGHYMVITKDSNTVAITHTVRVQHNDNGSKRITISATGSISDTTLTKTTISAEVALEDIPRAASVGASDGDIGSTVMVTIGRKSENHRHRVAYRFGSLEGFLTEAGISHTAAFTQAACLAFPLPEAFYAQIPDKAAELCTLTCTTFLEDMQIGSPQEASFTVRANPDRCGPLLTGAITDSNPQTLALTGDENIFVQGESTALCVMDAQPRWSATLTRKKIGDTVITGDSLEIPAFGQENVRFWVQDSRGHTAQEIKEVSMIPYFPPVIRLQASRKDPVSGEGQLTAQGNFFQGSFGACDNHLQLRWRLNNDPWQSVEATLEENTFTWEGDVSGMDYTRSHRITLEASDALHTVTAQADIQPGIPVFDWGREDFTFHVPVWVQDVEILKELLELKESSLKRTGDTMAGTLDMGNHSLTGLKQPEGDRDAVPKSYVDRKPEIRRLWTNSAPEEAFLPQSVELDLTEAEGVSILYKNENAGTLHMNTGYIPKGCNGRLSYLSQSSGKRSERRFSVSDSGVEFEAGSYSDGNSSNIHDIPLEIYGWYCLSEE